MIIDPRDKGLDGYPWFCLKFGCTNPLHLLKEFNKDTEKLLEASEEEFRAGMVAGLQFMLEMFFEGINAFKELDEQNAECFEMAIAANNRDFAIAEKNFKAVGERLDVLEELLAVLIIFALPEARGKRMPVKSRRYFCKLLSVDYNLFTEKLQKAINLLAA